MLLNANEKTPAARLVGIGSDLGFAVPRMVRFSKLGCRFVAAPHFSGHGSTRTPSR